MRVSLTGATGFIGAFAARALARAGHEVTALARPSSSTSTIKDIVTRFVTGDQRDPGIWAEFVRDSDAVVHNAHDWDALRSGDVVRQVEANVLGSVRLLEAVRQAGVERFCFVSSVATHHDIRPRWAGVIDEDHPLRPGSLYGASKAAVEPFLWWMHHEHGVRTTALRPAGVYGVEPVRLTRSLGYRAVKDVLDGVPVTPETHPGGGKFVHVEDVALAIVRSIERDEAAGRAFNLADCYAKRTRFAEHAAAIVGAPDGLVTPDTGPPASNRFSTDAAREVLGVSLDRGDEGLRGYVAELIGAIRERKS